MITVVSGLPRSGTSMMMQMLEAGGMPVATDGIRAADDDNPRGYMELEKVKELQEDPSFMVSLDGKAVKVVSMLLYHLPLDLDYRILFMERPLAEVLASQTRMLRRRGREPDLPDDEMASHYRVHLYKVMRWLREHDLQVMTCSYHDVLAAPEAMAEKVARFLGVPLDTKAMGAAVDPGLYRQRKGSA